MLAFGMTALNFALWANALNLLKGDENDGPMVGTVGSLYGGLGLIITAIWFGWTQPDSALLSMTTGMYGLVLLGFYFMQAKGLAAGPLGNLCLLVFLNQEVVLVAMFRGGTAFTDPVFLTFAAYGILVLLFNRLLAGKVEGNIVGYWLIVCAIGTGYIQFVVTGIWQ